MKIFPKYFLILTITVTVAFFSACSQKSEAPDSETLQNLGFRLIPEGNIFPDITFSDTRNKSHNLSEFRGSVILLNFWASWCPPCRAEMPAMERLAKELDGGDFVMIPINVQEPQILVESFITEFNIGFPVYLDEEASAAMAVGVTGLPTSILIDREGTAIAVVTGAIEWDSDEMISLMRIWTR